MAQLQYENIDHTEFSGIILDNAFKYLKQYEERMKQFRLHQDEVAETEAALNAHPVRVLAETITVAERLNQAFEGINRKEYAEDLVSAIERKLKAGRPCKAQLEQLARLFTVIDITELKMALNTDPEEYKSLVVPAKQARVLLQQVTESLEKMQNQFAEKCFTTLPERYRNSGDHPHHRCLLAFLNRWRERVKYYQYPVSINGISLMSMKESNKEGAAKLHRLWSEGYTMFGLGDIMKAKHSFKARSFDGV